MFTTIGYIWRPTGRTFTIVGNAPLRKPVVLDNETSKPAVTLVYSRKPRSSKTNVLVSKPKNACRPNCPLVFGLRLLQAYDQRSLSAHQFCQ
ncbi:hypothetical protein Tco_0904570 [Tanacetum coccineum]